MLEHLAIGAGSYAAVAAASGRDHRLAGLPCAALVAGWKEGSDAYAGRDTRGQAVFHALSILAGAGLTAAFYH